MAAALVVAGLAWPPRAGEIVTSQGVTPYLVVDDGDPYDLLAAHDGTIAVGDLSGDGIPDLVVGAMRADGLDNLRVDCGEVYVFFGPFVPGTVRDLATTPADITLFGRASNEGLGFTVLVADVNADGQEDLIMGTLGGRGPQQRTPVGEVYIYFGPLAAGVRDQATDTADLSILGPAWSYLGGGLAAGDLSGDGIVDLAIGSPRGPGEPLHVLFGPLAPGPPRDLEVTPADVVISGAASTTIRFGLRLRVADVSGDGRNDLIATADLAPAPNGDVNGGSAYVFFGSFTSGMRVDLATTPPDVKVTPADGGDLLGQSLAVVDLTGDGVAEILLGLPGARGPGNARGICGEVSILLGPVAPGVIDHVTTMPHATLYGAITSRLGFAMAEAVLPDGRGQVLVGAPGDRQSVSCSWGAAFVLEDVPPAGTSVDLAATPPPLTIGTDREGTGLSVHLADLTGDGWPEPIVSARVDSQVWSLPNVLHVIRYADRCEDAPPALPAPGLRLHRAGDDVVLEFDTSLTGQDSNSVDIFRGTIPALRIVPRYDHGLVPLACGLTSAPLVDAGAAAWGSSNKYYLGNHGCLDVCGPTRRYGSLGASSTGVARPGPVSSPEGDCP